MLNDILKNNECFKLVCGAGNENTEEVERLVYLYSKAGCSLFDLSANLSVVQAAKRGLEKSGITDNRYLCVSIGIKGDPHISKAEINNSICTKCDACRKVCLQGAILIDIRTNFIKRKCCIGCGKCLKVCKHGAISMYSQEIDLREVLPPIIKEGIDCLELHAIVENDYEVFEKWNILNALYDGVLSICIDREKLGNEKMLNRIKKMLSNRTPYSTIIQADGSPMSGGKDDYKTTLQAVATAEIIQNANLPVHILLSGGTNSKTAELAQICGIKPSGIAIGSFARKIVKPYIKREDFYTNPQIFNEALKIASTLVNKSLNPNYINKT